jgi:hypothetical protein
VVVRNGRRAHKRTHTAPSDEIERLMYGYSILHCLLVGMAEQPSVATDTVMRPTTLRRYRSGLLGSGDRAHRERLVALLPTGVLTLIHQSAWKRNSANFVFTEFSEVGLELFIAAC